MFKRLLATAAATAFLVGLIGCQSPAAPTTFDDGIFHDQALSRRIAFYVGEGGVQPEELAQFTELRLPAAGIRDITGLERFTNLQRLDLAKNDLTDLSPLAGLTKLEFLSLEDNAIEDVSPLAGLTGLKVLHLYKNRITDVAPLASLTNLDALSLEDNRIKDGTPLRGLNAYGKIDWSGNEVDSEGNPQRSGK